MPLILVFFLAAFFFSGCSFEHEESELCFIGDSITNQWDLDSYFPGYAIHKHAVGGARIQDMDKWDLSDCEGKSTIILMGTNNIGLLELENPSASNIRKKFIQQYMDRLKRIKAQELWVLSILPRNHKHKQTSSVNQHIEIVNNDIKEALKTLSTPSHFVNVFYDFLGDDYNIDEDLFIDGLHPNRLGYDILAKEVHKGL